MITLCSQLPLPNTLGLPQRQINIELFQTMVEEIGWQSKQLLFRIKKCLNKTGRFFFFCGQLLLFWGYEALKWGYVFPPDVADCWKLVR